MTGLLGGEGAGGIGGDGTWLMGGKVGVGAGENGAAVTGGLLVGTGVGGDPTGTVGLDVPAGLLP